MRYKYRTAATLGAWSIESFGPSRFYVTAAVVSIFEPWVSRVPIDVHLYISGNTWIWEGVVTWRDADDEERLSIEVDRVPTIIKGSS